MAIDFNIPQQNIDYGNPAFYLPNFTAGSAENRQIQTAPDTAIYNAVPAPKTTVPALPGLQQTGGGAGDFARTSVDDFYTNLLKGILTQPGTDFSQVNQPLSDYQKYASGVSANAIPQAYSDIVKGVGTQNEQQFQDYLKTLQQPSSAEEAIKQTQGDILQQTLKGIDDEIAKSVADIKLTGEEYGLSGPGRVSEPITSAIAQAQSSGVQSKAAARSQLTLSQLQEQAAKDKEVRDAYKARYEKGPVEQLMLAQAYPQFAQLQQNDKEMMYKMASAESDRRLQGLQLSSQEKQNLTDNLFKTMLTGLEIQSKESITGGQFDLQKFLQNQQLEWEKQKQAQNLEFQNKELGVRQQLGMEQIAQQQRQIDDQPGFWETLGQNTLSNLAGGVSGGVASGIGSTIANLF